MCKFWHEDDYGRGLMEICRLTGKEVSCCSDVNMCECGATRREEENANTIIKATDKAT